MTRVSKDATHLLRYKDNPEHDIRPNETMVNFKGESGWKFIRVTKTPFGGHNGKILVESPTGQRWEHYPHVYGAEIARRR